MNELACIITGPERNGTTLFKKILDSHPDIFSGFETGILLNKDFSQCAPFCDWIYNKGAHWGLDRDISLRGKSFSEKYDLLFEHKGSYYRECAIQNLIRKSRYLVDKTPAYIRKLKYIRENTCKDVPIFIIIKNFKNYYTSCVVKRKESEAVFLKKIQSTKYSLEYLNEIENSENIYLFQYEDVINNEPQLVNQIKRILSNRIDTSHDMSSSLFEEKMQKMQVDYPYSKWIPESTQLNEQDFLKYSKIQSNYDDLIQRCKQILM
jgi:hypothetical protein